MYVMSADLVASACMHRICMSHVRWLRKVRLTGGDQVLLVPIWCGARFQRSPVRHRFGPWIAIGRVARFGQIETGLNVEFLKI